eukprot:CAMPEP_0183707766 /NCGR_PEP_ID=MMETSP0737-20130205/4241_1 /TAXON_ID=385413 /ORGANISM="Thalassiosira miniscula, Strain CCMP1093" /LENGTH=316 /DNA_ID=CAMNT_0025935495 /DNA_START=642 /DNA_END=1592 /DNA_ORIENTATION=-
MMISSPTNDGARFNNGFVPAAGAVAPSHPNSNHGLKRLASCREELEQSWQGVTPQYLHCVSTDGSQSDTSAEGFFQRRTKRRRTTQELNPANNNGDMMMECSFVGGHRISPDNRPPVLQPEPQDSTRPQVKAGWYEGGVDARGNRHGRGITKHDDGTEYEGPYVEDVMEGPAGCYQFATTRHLVPNPRANGSHLHRQVEKSYEGCFKNDMPHGAGVIITKTTDCAPQVLGSMPVDVRFMEVVYDVGMHKSEGNGKAVGEGVRIIYTMTKNDGIVESQRTFFRLINGENTNLHIAHGYANWILQCMNVPFPEAPFSM